MNKKTLSEQFFEQFCGSNNIDFKPIKVGARRLPDYRIDCSGNDVIVEVKEFDRSPHEKQLRERLKRTGRTGAVNFLSEDDGSGIPLLKLDERVRTKIEDAVPQLQNLAGDKLPAVLVLFNKEILFDVNGVVIRLAMYDKDSVIASPSSDGTNRVMYAHQMGIMPTLNATRFTVLSAVALLSRKGDEGFQLAIYHNKFAARPFDPDWLRIDAITHCRLGDKPQEGGLIGWELF